MQTTPMIKIRVASWNRFRSEGLAVKPDVLGRAHDFEFEGERIRIRLPREEHLNKEEGHETLVDCYAWESDGSPLYYDILRVDVIIDVPQEMELEQALVSQPPRREHLTMPSKARFLGRIVDDHQSLALRAFDYWIRVIRWKNDYWRIGQPEVYGHPSGWGTRLFVKETGKNFWLKGSTVTLMGRKALTAELWDKIEVALNESLPPPTWFEFLFDARQKLEVGDNTGCVLSLAIATETVFRRILERQVPDMEKVDPAFFDTISLLNARTIINRIRKFNFWNSGNWSKHFQVYLINEIFNQRDKVMHLGRTSSIGRSEMERMLEAADRFIHFADNALK